MFHTKNILNKLMGVSLLASLGFVALLSLAQTDAALAATAPNLLSTSTYGVVSSTFSNSNTAPQTIINGSVCYTTVNLLPLTITGTTNVPCTTQISDQGSALTDLNNQLPSCISLGAAVDLSLISVGGGTPGVIPPGCYSSTGAMNIGSLVHLSGAGVYIFRPGAGTSAAALGTAANSIVALDNGACASNVFWAPFSATTLGANSTFVGTIIDAAGITIGGSATLEGRALAAGGTVTTAADTITLPTTCAPVSCPTISLLPPPLPIGTVGVPYSVTITASGGTGPYTFSMTAGTLPTGLSPITSGGLISGTPTTPGTFTFTIRATDANGCTGLQAYTIVINAPTCPTISLLPPPLPIGTVGIPYSKTITASGGTGPYTFSMTVGALPTGLSPITSGGLISGTPTTPGTFTFTVTATDANGCTGLRTYTVTIGPAAPTDVPTLNEWGAILFLVLAGLGSVYYLRRQKAKA